MKLLSYVLEKRHHAFRKRYDWHLAEAFSLAQLPAIERMAQRFERICAAETPVLLPEEQICLIRTVVPDSDDVFTQEEWQAIRKDHFVHELGYLSNLSPDYESAIAEGLLKKREQADAYGRRAIDALIRLTDRYRAQAEAQGRMDVAAVLKQVPRHGARNFREALQFFRILHYGLWLEHNYHVTVGRFDQYMLPYLQKDLDAGVHTYESALELLCDFFISFNKDSDLYPGVQQGDNGQSMVLGGLRPDGQDGFNVLSRMCLEASERLLLIDPKINLRVSSRTPLSVFELGSRLTRAGLGFPQYSNDDVVIPALEKLGYAHEDAVNYVVAACWEFIIPKVGADIANIGAMSYPKAVVNAMQQSLMECRTFDAFMERVRQQIRLQVEDICSALHDVWFMPSPWMNVLMGSVGIWNGARYNNFGIHGTGIATAADSLAAIRKYVFDLRSLTAETLIDAVAADFEGYPELLHTLRYEAPKMGQNDDLPDHIAAELLDAFAASLKGRVNDRGGVYRAGTGSAMYYLWHAHEIGATPDGRRKGEPFGTNYSPSLFSVIGGPLSVISSFTKQHVGDAINGGPLTLEFHNAMFQDDESIRKVAMLVKAFVDRGGHQLQLNAVNLETMRDAQLHPDRHRQLVVRIWGWSAYFVELDKEYQDHVMARQEYSV